MKEDNLMLHWFEIPVTSLEGAITFYSGVFKRDFYRMQIKGFNAALFAPPGTTQLNGALMEQREDGIYRPSGGGTIIYFDAGDSLDTTLKSVTDAGGKIITAKTLIAPYVGFYAQFSDLDDNTIGLRSRT